MPTYHIALKGGGENKHHSPIFYPAKFQTHLIKFAKVFLAEALKQLIRQSFSLPLFCTIRYIAFLPACTADIQMMKLNLSLVKILLYCLFGWQLILKLCCYNHLHKELFCCYKILLVRNRMLHCRTSLTYVSTQPRVHNFPLSNIMNSWHNQNS